MDRYITKSKYFSQDFNAAIFSDPIRIYFSNSHEAQALELYFKLQSRKNQWEKFLRARGSDNYCYILLYGHQDQLVSRFNVPEKYFETGEMGEDFILGIGGPLTTDQIDELLDNLDQTMN